MVRRDRAPNHHVITGRYVGRELCEAVLCAVHVGQRRTAPAGVRTRSLSAPAQTCSRWADPRTRRREPPTTGTMGRPVVVLISNTLVHDVVENKCGAPSMLTFRMLTSYAVSPEGRASAGHWDRAHSGTQADGIFT